MKNQYTFNVDFTYVVEADSYLEAVKLADKQLPDEDGKTTFVVDTMDYGFIPNEETVEKMAKWGDFNDPDVVIVDFETGEVVSDDS
jgi:hypothetical protein